MKTRKDMDYKEKNDQYFRRNEKFNVLFGLVVLLVLVSTAFFRNTSKQVTADFGSEVITFSYPDAEDIVVPYSEILSVKMEDVSDYGSATSGIATKLYGYGGYHNDQFGDYVAAVTLSVTRAMVIETKDDTFVANFGTNDMTDETYAAFLKQFPALGEN